MSKFKFVLSILLALFFSCAGVGCGIDNPYRDDPNNPKPPIIDEDDGYIAPLKGTETEVTILKDNGNIIGAGYSDQLIQNYSVSSIEGMDGLHQYMLTKQLHNYNVDNNNIRLKFEDWGWDDELVQKTTASFISGVGVDVLIGETQMTAYARQSLLKPFPDDLAEWIRENMLPSSYKSMEIEGKIYGITYSAAPQILIWNKDILKECKIDEEIIENGPKTWSEWIAVCNTVKSYKRGKYYGGGMYIGSSGVAGAMRILPFIKMSGGTIADSNDIPTFNEPNNVNALELIRELSLTNQSKYDMAVNAETTFHDKFFKGKTAFVTGASYMVAQAYDHGLTNLGWGVLPTPTEEQVSGTDLIGAVYLSVPKYSSNSEAAFKVIKSFLVEETQKVIAKSGLRPPANIKVGESDEVAGIAKFAYNTMRNCEVYYLPSFSKNFTDTWNCFATALSKAATTNEDISTLLLTAQNEFNKLSNN